MKFSKSNIHLYEFSLYPSVCIENDFPVGPGLHIKGPQQCSRLSLDYEKCCFVYNNPIDGTSKPVEGILQVIVGIERHHDQLNSLPFLPIRLGPEGRTFRGSCKKCLIKRKKSLCQHNMLQRRWLLLRASLCCY